MASLPMPSRELLTRFPMIERFCFAERPGSGDGAEVQFTFVLTSEDGRHMYGHCVRTVNAEVLCIVSRFAWCRLFRDLMFRYRANGEDPRIIEALYRADVPSPGHTFVLRPPPPCKPVPRPPPPPPSKTPQATGDHTTTTSVDAWCRAHCDAHDGGTFPLDVTAVDLRRPPDGVNPFVDAHPALLLRWMDGDTLLSTMAALLTERRIAVVGPDVGTVSSVILALLSLLRPFEWAHVLVPIVPDSLLGVLAAPTPLLVGLLANQVDEAVSQGGVNNVVVVRLRGCVPASELERRPVHGLEWQTENGSPVSSSPQSSRAASINGSTPFPTSGSSGSLSRLSSAFVLDRDREAGFTMPMSDAANSTVQLVEGDEIEDGTLPVPTLPFTSFALCSLRLAIAKARSVLKRRQSSRQRGRGHSASAKEATLEADRELLNAFLDYYVATFGSSLAPGTFNPLTFIEGTLRAHSSGSRKELQAAEDFFAAAMECIIYLQFRDRYVPALAAAQTAAASGRVDALSANLPESGGFAEAVLLAHPHLYPDASMVALKEVKEREAQRTGVATTLVSLTAPFWSLRALSGMCSYGISTASRKFRGKRGAASTSSAQRTGSTVPSGATSPVMASPPLSPAR